MLETHSTSALVEKSGQICMSENSILVKPTSLP